MSLNIQDILNSLEAGDTAEESFAAGLNDGTEKTAEYAEYEEQDMEKIAEELDAQGRIIARSFMDELEKIAVGVGPMTVNTGAIPNNPGVEVSRADIDQEQVAQVAQLIAQLQAGTQAGGGSVDLNGAPVSVAGPGIVDESPIVADQAAMQRAQMAGAQRPPGMPNAGRAEEVKQASDEILGSLYNTFFGE